MAGLKEILSWFEKNKYPTQEQFKESWTSFWHKSERIPASKIINDDGVGGGIAPITDEVFFANSEGMPEKGSYIRLNNIYTNIISSITGMSLNYEVVTEYADGTQMDISKLDGVIYRKRGDEYLRLITNHIVDLSVFGVQTNGLLDVTDKIQLAIDVTSKLGLGLYIPQGIYLIKAHDDDYQGTAYLSDSGGIAMQNNTYLVLHSKAVLQSISTDKKAYNIIRCVNKNNIKIIGGNLRGDRDTHSGLGGEWGYGLAILGCTNVAISDITISNCWGDGINIQVASNKVHPSNLSFNNVVCDNNRRQGMSIEAGYNITINDSSFNNTNGTSPSCGVDIEPWSTDHIVENVTFSNCNFLENSSSGLLIMGVSVSSINVVNCFFKNNNDTEGQMKTYGTSRNILISNNTFVSELKYRPSASICFGSGVIFENNILNNGGIKIATIKNAQNRDLIIRNNVIKSIYCSYSPIFTDRKEIVNLVLENNIVDYSLADFNQKCNRGICDLINVDYSLIRSNRFINTGVYILGKKVNIVNNEFLDSYFTSSRFEVSNSIISKNIITGQGYTNKDHECCYLVGSHNVFAENILNNELYFDDKKTTALIGLRLIGSFNTIVENDITEDLLVVYIHNNDQSNYVKNQGLLLHKFTENPKIGDIKESEDKVYICTCRAIYQDGLISTPAKWVLL